MKRNISESMYNKQENLKTYFGLHSGTLGFSGSLTGKESAYNAGDPDSIPGSGRFSGEGIGYPLQ